MKMYVLGIGGAQLAEGLRQMSADVGCQQAFFAYCIRSQITGQAVQIYAQATGLCWSVALCQQTQQNAGEHIAAACRGHAGISGRVEPNITLRAANGRIMAFEYYVYVFVSGQIHGFGEQTVATAGPTAAQSGQFTWMRGKDAAWVNVTEPVFVFGQNVQPIGINHGGQTGVGNLFHKSTCGYTVLTQSRSDGQCRVFTGGNWCR